MRREPGDAARFLEKCGSDERRRFVRAMFLKSIWFAGTNPVEILRMARLFIRTSLTDEDRYLLKHGGPCTPRLWMQAAIQVSREDAKAYARQLAAEVPGGVREPEF